MKLSKLSAILASATVLFSLQLSTPTSAHADTYQLVDLSTDVEVNFYGLTDSGQVVFIQYNGHCDGRDTTCYGTPGHWSSVAPALSFDNGDVCAPSSLPAGATFVQDVCNNGRGAYYGYFPKSPSDQLYVFTGTNPPQGLFGPALTGGLHMNKLGDVVFDDGFGDGWLEAVDLTSRAAAPEPSALALLATGIFAPILFLRRRTAPVGI